MTNANKRGQKTEDFVWTGMHPFFYDPFISYFTPDLRGKVILDCGCGKGMLGYLTKATRDMTGAKMIGLDSSEKVLSFCKKHNVYDKLVKHKLPSIPLKDKSVDFLLCTEVIEHFTKKDGSELLNEIDRVCRGRSLISTPNVFFPNPPGIDEDVHKSLWGVKDFKVRGYKVYGLGFKVPLVNTDPFYKIKQALHYIATPLSYFYPQVSGFLLCVKEYK